MKIKFEVQGEAQQEWIMNPNQERFIKSISRYIGYVGGRGCGKSLALVLKIIHLLLKYPGNYGLIGRFNYNDLRDTTEADFYDVCPKQYILERNKQEHRVTFINRSQVIFRGLKDIKKTEVRSLNLGFFGLEQAEEIEESLFDELSACLRRKLKDFEGKMGLAQGFVLANPALTWLFKKFKQSKDPAYEFIAGSMLDNKDNLPKAFVDDMMSKPDSWKRIFVYGEFDENLLAGRAVFPVEYIRSQALNIKEPILNLDDIQVFKDVQEGHNYRLGVDSSEGAYDFAVIKGVDEQTGEEVCCYAARIQPDLLAYKVDKIGRYFNGAKVVLEINGSGLATLSKLKDLSYENIWMREEFDKIAKVITKKLGWRTTHASKPLLISHYLELLNKGFVKLRDEQTLQEMKTYVYSDEARKRGMGAERGFFDDRITATMLAYWDLLAEPRVGDNEFVVSTQEIKTYSEDRDRLFLKDILGDENKPQHWLED